MKKIIAREWLFLISFILIGSILTIHFYFNDNNQFIEKNNLYNYKRHHFYNTLTEEFKIKAIEKTEIAEEKIINTNEDKQDPILELLKKAKMNNKTSPNSNSSTNKNDLKTKQLQKNPYKTDLSKIEPPLFRMDLGGIIKSVREDTCKPLSRLQQWAAVKFNDTIYPLGTYEQFYAILDEPKERKEFYDNLFFNSSYINDYSSFEVLFLPPVKSSLFNDFLEFYGHLFSKYHWFQTWLSVLLLYFVFIFIRTIV